MRQFTEDEVIVLNWVAHHGFIVEPANDVARQTCEELRSLGLFEFHPADAEKRFQRYQLTDLGRQTVDAFFAKETTWDTNKRSYSGD